jgi:hypothetical protein
MKAVIFSIEQYELNLEGPRTWAEIIFYSSVQKTLSARAADQPTRTFEAFAHQAILQPDRLPDVTARFLVSLKKLVTRSGALEQPDLSCIFWGTSRRNGMSWSGYSGVRKFWQFISRPPILAGGARQLCSQFGTALRWQANRKKDK